MDQSADSAALHELRTLASTLPAGIELWVGGRAMSDQSQEFQERVACIDNFEVLERQLRRLRQLRMSMDFEKWLEQDRIPDPLIRAGIRRLLAARLKEESEGGVDAQAQRLMRFVKELKQSPVAIETDAANEQHYEVPTEFYLAVLGPRMKYSSGFWPVGVNTLAASELAMLDLTAKRAQLADGQNILELGCGWGSLSLYMAEKFPA